MITVTRTDSSDSVEFLMDSMDEFKRLKSDRASYLRYVRQLYQAIVGKTMPVKIKVVVPIPKADMLGGAMELAETMGAEGGKLVFVGTVSHRELDGHPLSKEHLPMLASGMDEKDVAREIAQCKTNS